MHPEVLALQTDINGLVADGVEVGELRDGHHSFNELYAHRIELFKTKCTQRKRRKLLRQVPQLRRSKKYR